LAPVACCEWPTGFSGHPIGSSAAPAERQQRAQLPPLRRISVWPPPTCSPNSNLTALRWESQQLKSWFNAPKPGVVFGPSLSCDLRRGADLGQIHSRTPATERSFHTAKRAPGAHRRGRRAGRLPAGAGHRSFCNDRSRPNLRSVDWQANMNQRGRGLSHVLTAEQNLFISQTAFPKQSGCIDDLVALFTRRWAADGNL